MVTLLPPLELLQQILCRFESVIHGIQYLEQFGKISFLDGPVDAAAQHIQVTMELFGADGIRTFELIGEAESILQEIPRALRMDILRSDGHSRQSDNSRFCGQHYATSVAATAFVAITGLSWDNEVSAWR